MRSPAGPSLFCANAHRWSCCAVTPPAPHPHSLADATFIFSTPWHFFSRPPPPSPLSLNGIASSELAARAAPACRVPAGLSPSTAWPCPCMRSTAHGLRTPARKRPVAGVPRQRRGPVGRKTTLKARETGPVAPEARGGRTRCRARGTGRRVPRTRERDGAQKDFPGRGPVEITRGDR